MALKNRHQELEKYQSQLQSIPKELEELKKGRQEKWDRMVGPHVEKWNTDKQQLQSVITQLKESDVRQKQLQDIKDGKVLETKKGLFGFGKETQGQRKLTSSEETELKQLLTDQVKRSMQIEAQKKAMAERTKDVSSDLNKIEETHLEMFDSRLREKEQFLKNLPELINLKKEELTSTLERQSSAKSTRDLLGQELKDIQTSLDELDGVVKNHAESLARLLVMESAMQASNDKAVPSNLAEFRNQHLQELQNKLNSELQQLGLSDIKIDIVTLNLR